MNRSGARIAVLTEDDLREIIARAVRDGVSQALGGMREPSEMGEEEAAKYLGVSPATLRTWRCQKRGPVYHKSGRIARYSRADLDHWIRESRVLTVDAPEVSQKCR